MIVAMLAAAMTIAMLIGTAVGLREEAENVRVKARSGNRNGFAPLRR
jgi:hypothetical protein